MSNYDSKKSKMYAMWALFWQQIVHFLKSIRNILDIEVYKPKNWRYRRPIKFNLFSARHRFFRNMEIKTDFLFFFKLFENTENCSVLYFEWMIKNNKKAYNLLRSEEDSKQYILDISCDWKCRVAAILGIILFYFYVQERLITKN